MRFWVPVVLLFTFSACGKTSSEYSQNQRAMVDTSRHTVPLDEIIFDTFQPGPNRALPLPKVSPEAIQRLRNAIPPINNPKYQTPDEAKWLKPGDEVIGFVTGEESWAFPLKILNFHEIVNDTLAGHPVLISFCPLCHSGIVYSRILDDRELTFGNTSALYESGMVMFDDQTGSFWWQVSGEAIVGELSKKKLTVMPSITTTYEQWLEKFPNTKVLSWYTGYSRNYNSVDLSTIQRSLNQGQFIFPVSSKAQDRRLPFGTKVLLVEQDGQTKAYPLDNRRRRVINDRIGETPVAVFAEPKGPSGAIYQRSLDGEVLEFKLSGDAIQDRQSGSTWDIIGHAVKGPMQGKQLPPVPAKITYWFAAKATDENLILWQNEEENP